MTSVSIVMPVYNEEKVIERVIEDNFENIIRKIPDSEFLICEDGSTDRTKEILRRMEKKYPIKLYSSEQKKGYLKAAKDAISLAKGDWIFFTDSDDQHFAEDFWKLYEKKDDADLICGSRINRNDPLLRKVLSKIYNAMMRFTFGIKVRDFNAGFKLMNSKVAKSIVPDIQYLTYGFSTELVIRAHHAGFNIGDVEVRHKPRLHGVAEQFTLGRIPKVVFTQLKGMIKLRNELSSGKRR